MKKIMLILVCVILFFSACGAYSSTQIDPAEEFGDVIFGMTKEEVIDALNKKPDDESESYLTYRNRTFLNISNATIYYDFNNYDKFDNINVYYYYITDAEKEHILNDYSAIKKILLKNYPPKTHGYFSEDDDSLSYTTENRSILLFLHDNNISLDISDIEQISSDYDENAET